MAKPLKTLNVIERINLLIEAENLTREAFAQRTGISYTRWTNVLQRKAKLRHEEIEAIGRVWPEYGMWLAYGDGLPKVTQRVPKITPEVLR